MITSCRRNYRYGHNSKIYRLKRGRAVLARWLDGEILPILPVGQDVLFGDEGGGRMNILLTAQDLLKSASGDVYGGFNSRIFGETYAEACHYPNQDRSAGWWKADEMIKEGKCFFVERFPHPPCSGYAFPYGGSWVCNSCGSSNLKRSWWTIKVVKDGNAYCCYGLDFINLQESDNYAYGDSFQSAIINYGKIGRNETSDLEGEAANKAQRIKQIP